MKTDSLLHDKNTNSVFFSPWLKDKKEGHPSYFPQDLPQQV